MAGEEPYKYRQIADDLRARVRGGEYEPGGRLPSKAKLMERYSVSLGTLNDAYRILRSEGLIRTEQGSATFVCDPIPPEQAEPEAERLAGDVATLKADLASLLEKVSEIEAKLIDLYGKNGYQYNAGTGNGGQQKRRARHG